MTNTRNAARWIIALGCIGRAWFLSLLIALPDETEAYLGTMRRVTLRLPQIIWLSAMVLLVLVWGDLGYVLRGRQLPAKVRYIVFGAMLTIAAVCIPLSIASATAPKSELLLGSINNVVVTLAGLVLCGLALAFFKRLRLMRNVIRKMMWDGQSSAMPDALGEYAPLSSGSRHLHAVSPAGGSAVSPTHSCPSPHSPSRAVVPLASPTISHSRRGSEASTSLLSMRLAPPPDVVYQRMLTLIARAQLVIAFLCCAMLFVILMVIIMLATDAQASNEPVTMGVLMLGIHVIAEPIITWSGMAGTERTHAASAAQSLSQSTLMTSRI